jgi:hypothetical protein
VRDKRQYYCAPPTRVPSDTSPVSRIGASTPPKPRRDPKWIRHAVKVLSQMAPKGTRAFEASPHSGEPFTPFCTLLRVGNGFVLGPQCRWVPPGEPLPKSPEDFAEQLRGIVGNVAGLREVIDRFVKDRRSR